MWIGLSPDAVALFARASHHAGTLDPTFGDGGVVVTTLGKDSTVTAIEAMDGGLVVAATIRHGAALVRYLADGTLDPAFGSGGVVTQLEQDRFVDLAEGIDGSLFVLTFRYLERRTAVGTLDASFGEAGSVDLGSDDPSSMGVAPDGSIVVAAGTLSDSGSDLTVMRFAEDGSLDPAFGAGGKATLDLGTRNDRSIDVALLADGSILALVGRTTTPQGECCRNSAALVHLLEDGSLDPRYGEGGVQTFRLTTHNASGWLPAGVGVDGTGRAVVLMTAGGAYGCPSGYYSYLVRRTPDGRLDDGFGRGGHAVVPFVDPVLGSIALQPDGGILVGGETCDTGAGPPGFGIVRFAEDGALDARFGADGLAASPIGRWGALATAITLQRNGRILVAGPVLPGLGGFRGPRIAVARFFGT
jgi:uncharacterized delta-60 repeat protein